MGKLLDDILVHDLGCEANITDEGNLCDCTCRNESERIKALFTELVEQTDTYRNGSKGRMNSFDKERLLKKIEEL